MKRVIGIGGIFIQAKDPTQLLQWYQQHLGLSTEDWGVIFKPEHDEDKEDHVVFSVFPQDTTYFKPGDKPYMINFKVDNLEALLTVLREEGLESVSTPEFTEYGNFAWIMDPEGNKIELWEPPLKSDRETR